MDHRQSAARPWYWWLNLALVTYIALIGIFAIEELNGRDETLRVLLAEEARVGTESTSAGTPRAAELDRLRGLRYRVNALVVAGAPSRRLTLKDVQCDLVKQHGDPNVCQEPAGTNLWEKILRAATAFFLKDLSAVAGSGQILGVLIITASIGGALITLSLNRTHTESPLRTVLRAMGGGIVCYLAVDGGSLPLTVVEVSRRANPATASLYGLLAGMFSERVFRLLSDLVDAFLARITPRSEKSPVPQPHEPSAQGDAA